MPPEASRRAPHADARLHASWPIDRPLPGHGVHPAPDTRPLYLSVMGGPRRRHVLHAVALVVGGIAFAFLVDRLGWTGITRVIVGTGWWFVLIAACDLASVLCDAAGIRCFARAHADVSYWRVFAAQSSGVAINRLTPGHSLGEPIKATMLMEHVPPATAISAIVMFNAATVFLAIAAIVIGVPLTMLAMDLPPRARILVGIAAAVLALFAIALVMLIRRGMLATLIHAARRIRLVGDPRATRWIAAVAETDRNIRELGTPGHRRGLLYVVASRCLNWTGTLVILYSADIPLSPPMVIGALTVGILITWLSNIIPLGLGLADGGNYLLYGALGSSRAAGLDFTMAPGRSARCRSGTAPPRPDARRRTPSRCALRRR